MDLIFQLARRAQGSNAFRKRLGVYSLKHKHDGYHKKPGLIDVRLKEFLKKQGLKGRNKIHQLEQNSDRLLGTFTKRGGFIVDKKRIPFLDIPNLTGFELKPYVSVHTPRIDKADLQKIRELNNFKNPANFGRYNQQQIQQQN